MIKLLCTGFLLKCVSESSLSECESEGSDKEVATLEGSLDLNTFAVVPSEPIKLEQSTINLAAQDAFKMQVSLISCLILTL